MSNLDYIAACIDCDGSINISYNSRDKGPRFVVNFRQVARYGFILEEIQNTLGCGKIYNHTNTLTSQPMLTWQTTNEADTLYVCKTLLGFLRIKKDQAQHMINALEIWQAGRLGRRGAGYYHTEESKRQVMEISTLMNPSQQKETSRRNKDIRLTSLSTEE